MNRISWILVIASSVAVGCAKRPSESVDSLVLAKPIASPPRPVRQQFDFGPVLINGDPLRHEFVIDNPTGDTIQIVRSTALTPCCSSIENYPEAIPPFGKVVIPVAFKPGQQSGFKSVSFHIELDKPAHADHLLDLIADLHPEWEVIRSEGNPTSLPLGMGGRLEFNLICWSRGNDGFQLPESIMASEPLKVVDDPTKSEVDRSDDFVESKRRIAVNVPPGSRVGWNRGSLRFRWSAGQEREYDFSWEVHLAVKVNPSILIFSKKEGPRDRPIILTSDQRPFRVTEVAWPFLGERPRLPERAGRVQKVVLQIDPARIDHHGNAGEILLRTDHPDQPTVGVKVMILDDVKEEVAR